MNGQLSHYSDVVWLRGAKGAYASYAETPKASTFQASNAPKGEAEGVERLHLGICGDVVVISREYGSPTLMFRHKMFAH